MTEPAFLSDESLGDLAAILPGAALADATNGGIGPDPDVKRAPTPRQDPPERERAVPPEPDSHVWIRSGIGILVACRDAGLQGFAVLGGPRQRISPNVIRVARGGRFRVDVFFHVDATGMPRPLPFAPPQVGLQWSYTPDGGDPTDTAVFWDPGPIYRGAGDPLLPNFDNTVGFVVPESGWLTLSARIDDREGAVEFDDTIRLLVES
jgi:hypothetical protein